MEIKQVTAILLLIFIGLSSMGLILATMFLILEKYNFSVFWNKVGKVLGRISVVLFCLCILDVILISLYEANFIQQLEIWIE